MVLCQYYLWNGNLLHGKMVFIILKWASVVYQVVQYLLVILLVISLILITLWSPSIVFHSLHFVISKYINTLWPRQNGRHFADDTFNRIFVNANARISIKFSLKFVPKGPINNIPALVQIMAWHRPGDKPLSEPVMVSLLTHICVTRPQWVNVKSMLIVIV